MSGGNGADFKKHGRLMANKFHILANPARFTRISKIAMPILATGTIAGLVLGLYGALWVAPPDYLQHDTARIMYVHVPAAWMAMMVYAALGMFSAGYLIWRHPVSDLLARGASPIGACFTAVALLTGMLWGKPTWGTPWVWDARLTSVLILLFLYLGHMVMLRASENVEQSSRMAAILAVIGLINLPIIKFSVDWWNTLHQSSSISSLTRIADPSIDASMLWPLLIMALAFLCWAVFLLFLAARVELAKRRLMLQWQDKAGGHG